MITPTVLLIDHHDSFTYNIVQMVRELGAAVHVRLADEVDCAVVELLAPSHVVLSPGPGRPDEAEASLRLLERVLEALPVLGVCLGHQILVTALGGTVTRAPFPIHGKASQVYHDGRTLYEGLPVPFEAGRYHSLTASQEKMPHDLRVTAFTSDGEIMGVRHTTLPVEGVQFHPESVLTPEGAQIFRNFLGLRAATRGAPIRHAPLKARASAGGS